MMMIKSAKSRIQEILKHTDSVSLTNKWYVGEKIGGVSTVTD